MKKTKLTRSFAGGVLDRRPLGRHVRLLQFRRERREHARPERRGCVGGVAGCVRRRGRSSPVAALNQLETDLATAQNDLSTAQGQITTLTGERDALQAQISGDPNDPADMGLNGQIADLNGQITTLTGERDALQAQVSGDPNDPADMGLMGQVADLNGQITTLTGERDALQAQVSGDPNDPADMGLMGQVADLNQRINGDPNDPDDTGLVGQLADANATITSLRNQLTMANTLSGLRLAASTAMTDATNARKAAEQALKDAQKYAVMLGVLDVGGDSGMAEANAGKVLAAEQAAMQAVIDATAAKTRAQTAKTDATALPDDAPDKAGIIAALDAAIKAADDEIKAAMDIRDGDALEDAVEMVEGTATKKMTAADRGKEVAGLINTALTTDAQTPAVVADFSTVPTAAVARTDSVAGSSKPMAGPSDAQGRTFAQIFASRVMDKRIAAGAPSGSASRAVKAVSVAGMTAADVSVTASPGTADGTEVDPGVAYKGINGVLFCAGTDCKVEDVVEGTFAAATSKLTGSWYFAPDDGDTATYTEGTGDAAGTYSLEDPANYVRFGYWLSIPSGTSNVTTINRYVDGPDAQTTAGVYAIDVTVPAFAGSSATYEGDALGMSVVWENDGNGRAVEGTLASGGFTADVELKMLFGVGTGAALSGTISNFQGSAVNSGWEVELKNGALASGTFASPAPTDGGDTAGEWTATAWGGSDAADSQARPAGVFGAFDADFTNGAAVGVYSTRKQ